MIAVSVSLTLDENCETFLAPIVTIAWRTP